MAPLATSTPPQPMVVNLGPTEIQLVLLVLVLLFGAKKLPELARGSGRALRIFKAETKGLLDDDPDRPADSPTAPRPVAVEAAESESTEAVLLRPLDHPAEQR